LEKAAHFPCLILLDLAMPILDGRGFLELRAKDPMLRQIRSSWFPETRHPANRLTESTLICKNP
jgi:hypothetical protein